MTSNAELLTRRKAALPRGIATMASVFAYRAVNAEILDVEWVALPGKPLA